MTGAQVRAARERLGLTQRELADRVGVAPNTVACWERDVKPVGKTAGILIRLLANQAPKRRRR